MWDLTRRMHTSRRVTHSTHNRLDHQMNGSRPPLSQKAGAQTPAHSCSPRASVLRNISRTVTCLAKAPPSPLSPTMSSSTRTWKSQLGFSERFAVIDNIASSLKLDPTVQHSQALKSAQAIETQCFDDANSEEDYTFAWKSELEQLKAQAHQPADISPPFSPRTPNDSPFFSGFPGITLGKYTPCYHHASGLFSAIYRTYPLPPLTSPTSLVALKVTTPSTMVLPHDSKREARILAAIAGHKNVIPLLETFTLPPSSFVLVFPFYKHDLGALLRGEGPELDMQMKIDVLQSTAEALKWCHEHHVLHRDVKPSNILISMETQENISVVLADFGIAWMDNDPASEAAENKITDVGTTAYRPPEILFGWKSYGTKLDMWAFGCVVAECFTKPQLAEIHPYEDETNTFFDAGDLGSELRLVGSIFGKLGTPSTETWPEAARFPDFGKILFHPFPKKSWEELLPDASEVVRDLVGSLLVYESGMRLSADEVLEHELFRV